MKKMIALSALIAATQAFAVGITSFQEGDIGLQEALAKIISVSPLCPPRPDGITCRAYGSRVRIEVELVGCMDNFGGHSTAFKEVDGKGYIYFSAINLNNERSEVTRCVKAPVKTLEMAVPFVGEVELVNLNFVGAELPTY